MILVYLIVTSKFVYVPCQSLPLTKYLTGGTFQRYDPTKTLFRNITKINPYLLQDVVNCYEHFKTVCRTCFYKHNHQEPIGANRHCHRCKRTTHPLVVIPASKMCNNLTGAKVLAIPSPPRTMMAIENKYALCVIQCGWVCQSC